MHTHTFHHLKPQSITTIAINVTVQIEKESGIGLQAREGGTQSHEITCSFINSSTFKVFTQSSHSVPHVHSLYIIQHLRRVAVKRHVEEGVLQYIV